MMLVYYFVQPIRYFIFGISGCGAAYDASWPSIVAIWMWQPIIITVGSYYAVLLLYRLYRYRREFSRLIAARDTTKSRFIRLLVMSLLLCFATLPYSWYLLYTEVKSITGPFDWSTVHGPKFNSVIMIPSGGLPYYDSWGRIAVGYVIFFVFGTGQDAKTLYKKMLVACGLGRIWPSLHNTEDTSTSRSRSSSSRSWFWLGNKTKSFFTSTRSSTTASRTTQSQDPTRSESIQPAMSMDIVVASQTPLVSEHTSHTKPSFIKRLFSNQPANEFTILPLHSHSAKRSIDHSELSPTSTYSAGPSSLHPFAHTHAWVEGGQAAGGSDAGGRASGTPQTLQHSDNTGVKVVKEVKQERKDLHDEKKNSGDLV
jgi:pheromone a factor receptor